MQRRLLQVQSAHYKKGMKRKEKKMFNVQQQYATVTVTATVIFFTNTCHFNFICEQL